MTHGLSAASLARVMMEIEREKHGNNTARAAGAAEILTTSGKSDDC